MESICLEEIDQTWMSLVQFQSLMTFKFVQNRIHSFGETSGWESFFHQGISLHLNPCLWSFVR